MMDRDHASPGIFYGWWVVITCSMIGALSSAGRFSFSIFFPTLLDDLGWTRAMLGFGLTLHMWVYATTVIVIGILVDKYGARLIMVMGGLLILLGLVLTSAMRFLWQFYIYYGIILALGVAATLSVPVQATARKWFIKRAGLATALAASGMNLGFGLVVLVSPTLIGLFGWRRSWLYIGCVAGAAIVLLAGVVVRKDPESMGLYPDGAAAPPAAPENKPGPGSVDHGEPAWTVPEALKTRSYWLLLFGYGLIGVNYIGVSGHVTAWGLEVASAAKIPPHEAMNVIKLSVFLLATLAAVGGLIGGPLSDRIGRKPVFVASNLLLFGTFIYATRVHTLPGLLVVCLASGILLGLCIPLWAVYLGDIFGRASLASLFGLLTFSMGIIGGSGPVIFGWIFDVTGSYDMAWLFAASTTLITCVLVLLTRKETKKG